MANDEDRLHGMLADFESAHALEGRALRQMLDSTPDLEARMRQAADHGQLSGFAPHPENGMGSYDPETGQVQVPMDALGAARMDDHGDTAANTTRIVLGHEIGHAINKADIERTDQAFQARIADIAKLPSPHDYTQALGTRNEVQRIREAKDEIAGINALADYLKRHNPEATLGDLYNASLEMHSYIAMEGDPPDVTYKAREGLAFGNDLKIDDGDDRNVEAMGKLFYDARGYPQNYGAIGLGLIAQAEEEARLANPSRTRPQVRADLKSLGIDPDRVPPEWMPEGFRDTSADAVAPPAPAAEAPAKRPGGADRALDDKVRAGVAAAEQALGKGWDDSSERLTASLTLLAKQNGFDARDDLAIAFNTPTPRYQGGALAFVYRTGATASPDPYANRAQMSTDEAIARPAHETYRQLLQYDSQAEARRQSEEQPAQALAASPSPMTP